MELSLDLEDNLENEEIELENPNLLFLPKSGRFLGLDISESSTGICIYSDGTKFTTNFSLNLPEKSVFEEVLLRRCLKSNLSRYISGKVFDVIVIEDVFQGINAETTRKLYALNTAIDEMILDGEVECKKFLRVSNQTWKSWLFTVDDIGFTKGMNDKLKIETCLSMLGIREDGEGYQDRLDATGMLIGYFLCKDRIDDWEKIRNRRRVVMEDVEIVYDAETSGVFNAMVDAGVEEYLEATERKWSKTKILDHLTENPQYGFISSDLVLLGRLAYDYNLPIIDDGGYLGFWVKRNKLKKYFE